jgi:LemA protein
MKKPLLTLGAVALVLGMWLMGTYNSLVGLNQGVESQWAQVETQYQRRFDLVPNLVESTKGVLTQEQEVFAQIAEARQGYAGAGNANEKVAAANQMESALGRLLVIVENYPELKSNETVQDLMVELAGTENRVSVERKRYNDTVKGYNTKVKTFPTLMIANMFGYDEKPYFEAVEAAETAPEVDLNLN